jgi:phosphoribosylformimino-5-aminoimidazole carboxamide ribotide isomerase
VLLLPAIDIRDGRCVRLKFGDFHQETRYEVDPVELASRYAALGASWLHVVDLDGAARGEPENLRLIAAMRARAGICVQLGGGIRTRDSLERALDSAERIVVGSLAISEPETIEAWISDFGPERFTLALDVRLADDATPFVTTHGWQRETETTLWAALERYRERSVRHVLCTDVGRDGAMLGPNLELYTDCLRRFPDVQFQASGGVRDANDLVALRALGMPRAVAGKALLEGRITDEELRSFLPSE